MLSGLSLVGLTTSGDANIALRYTLLSIAGVILGGGEFTGGRISPVGAVIGAMTLTLAGSFLSFLRLNPDWQIGAQGAILILVLALRVVINRAEVRGKMTALREMLGKPWLGAYAGATAIWLATIAFTHGLGGGGVLTAALSFATFSVLVAIGQMYVITLGPGNVDLSIPATMTLAGAVSMKIMDGSRANDRARACDRARLWRGRRRFQLRADPVAAHPADHRHAVVQLPVSVRRDLLQPGPPHQAAAGARRLHHVDPVGASRCLPSRAWSSPC